MGVGPCPRPQNNIPGKLDMRVLLLLLLLTSVAYGHSWYEPACCSGYDCKPVNQEDLEELSGGCWRYIPLNLKFCGPQVRPSQDSKWHVCYREVKVLGSIKPYCVYIQNGS